MATGMVSSAQTLGNAKTVIRAGEHQATSAAALADPNSKTYYHMVKGAKFVMPDGLEIHFLGGRYVTNEKDQIEELDKVANKSTSLIYTIEAAAGAVQAAVKKAAEDSADTAGKTPETK